MNSIRFVHEEKTSDKKYRCFERAKVYLNGVELNGLLSASIKIGGGGMTEATFVLTTQEVIVVQDDERTE